ncbi:PAS domain S-box-containing protein [Flavobacterium sp. PL11]|uniref:PAS domain S-box protein n=1 Tax=Flavobacterium sp. PL11 TaxID=3071717 RepID=UPI002DFC219C|nr:PAS domain S-box-containing protein [Flavobacterium sp. PL11]
MDSKEKQDKFAEWFYKRPKLTGFITFLILSYIASFIVFQQYKLMKEDEQREMNTILNVIRQNIEQSLKNCYTTTLTLALTIDDEGIPKDFDIIAKRLIASNYSIHTVQLSPNGIVKYIYPLESNRGALNLNILNDVSNNKDALKSIATKKMYFAGPQKLKQGGLGIIGRFPVFENNKFWGFSSVILSLKSLLKSAGIENIDNSKYYFQFSKYDMLKKKETFYLSNPTDFTKHYSMSTTIPDGDWKLHIIAKEQNFFQAQILIPGIIGIFLAALFGVLIFNLLKKPKELELLINAQARKLINSEIKYQVIFDQAAVGIAYLDSFTGKFIETNEKYCQLLGYTQKEMKELNFQSITHPEDLAEDLVLFENIKEGLIENYSIEKRLYIKNGDVLWINLTVSPLLKEDYSFVNHIAIIEDISIKKNAEILIKNSEIRFKSLFEDTPIPLWEVDFSDVKKYLLKINLINQKPKAVNAYLKANSQIFYDCLALVRVIDVNAMSLTLCEFENKENLKLGFSKIIGSDAIGDFSKIITAITQKATQGIFDTTIINANKEIRNIDLRWNVIHGYEENLERIIISTEEITERKNSEKIIVESQLRIESLINTIDGIVWECDAINYTFNFISNKVTKILAYTTTEWLSSPTFWLDHVHEEDRVWVQEFCDNQIKLLQNHEFEYRMIAKDGRTVWMRNIVTIISSDGIATQLRGLTLDITKNKEAEKELHASFQLVSEQNKRLLNFSYIISHNLRSHTSNIASIISLIESAENEEEREQFLELLKSVSASLDETMLHLNEVININTNTSILTEPLRLQHYITMTTNLLQDSIKINEVEITNEIDPDCTIIYNPAYLESVLYNIISNAIRYRHSERKPKIIISLHQENGFNVLTITDNGIGIDLKRNGNKIFGMYKTFSTNADSKGLGLFITKNQIDAMGGFINVESELNIGTTFKIYIK